MKISSMMACIATLLTVAAWTHSAESPNQPEKVVQWSARVEVSWDPTRMKVDDGELRILLRNTAGAARGLGEGEIESPPASSPTTGPSSRPAGWKTVILDLRIKTVGPPFRGLDLEQVREAARGAINSPDAHLKSLDERDQFSERAMLRAKQEALKEQTPAKLLQRQREMEKEFEMFRQLSNEKARLRDELRIQIDRARALASVAAAKDDTSMLLKKIVEVRQKELDALKSDEDAVQKGAMSAPEAQQRRREAELKLLDAQVQLAQRQEAVVNREAGERLNRLVEAQATAALELSAAEMKAEQLEDALRDLKNEPQKVQAELKELEQQLSDTQPWSVKLLEERGPAVPTTAPAAPDGDAGTMAPKGGPAARRQPK